MLNPESNVQFGEGGAGTFSDGKLYSQIKDPQHHGRKVLTEFVKAGAPEEILYVSKPHIGTFRLVTMVEHMRATHRIAGRRDPFRQPRRRPAASSDGQRARRDAGQRRNHCAPTTSCWRVGHSARDTFEMLHARGVFIEAKPFSIGFRIEHPQSLIDQCRFGPQAGHPLLGAADYKLVHHCRNGRSVYSFCMCPGGTVVAAASEPGRVVTNGMSQYSRNERNANGAIVVGITPEDYAPYLEGGGPLAGIALQRHWESRAFEARRRQLRRAGAAGRRFPATAVHRRRSAACCLPTRRACAWATSAIACRTTRSTPSAKRCRRSTSRSTASRWHDALLTGVETRTSSPLRIKRGEDCQSLNTRGLYPAGEGAGYAGGILSAARGRHQDRRSRRAIHRPADPTTLTATPA